MDTRAEAVEYLKKFGLGARERDWSHGQTIQVVGELSEIINGVRIYRDGLHIYPRDGLWSILHDNPPDERRMSLRDACDTAVQILKHASKA